VFQLPRKSRRPWKSRGDDASIASMKRRTVLFAMLIAAILVALPSGGETTSPRAIQLPDILAW